MGPWSTATNPCEFGRAHCQPQYRPSSPVPPNALSQVAEGLPLVLLRVYLTVPSQGPALSLSSKQSSTRLPGHRPSLKEMFLDLCAPNLSPSSVLLTAPQGRETLTYPGKVCTLYSESSVSVDPPPLRQLFPSLFYKPFLPSTTPIKLGLLYIGHRFLSVCLWHARGLQVHECKFTGHQGSPERLSCTWNRQVIPYERVPTYVQTLTNMRSFSKEYPAYE